MLKKQTERVRVIGSSDPAAFMSRSFNCPSETRSKSTMHGCPPSFLSLGPTQQDTAQPKRPLREPYFISLVKSSFGSLKTKEMDQKKGGLLQRAMPSKPTEGSRIRPLASTYNVMITLVYPFFFGSLTDGRPSNKKRYKYGNFSAIWIGEFMEEIGF